MLGSDTSGSKSPSSTSTLQPLKVEKGMKDILSLITHVYTPPTRCESGGTLPQTSLLTPSGPDLMFVTDPVWPESGVRIPGASRYGRQTVPDESLRLSTCRPHRLPDSRELVLDNPAGRTSPRVETKSISVGTYVCVYVCVCVCMMDLDEGSVSPLTRPSTPVRHSQPLPPRVSSVTRTVQRMLSVFGRLPTVPGTLSGTRGRD